MATPIPRNRAAFTVEEILRATGGALVTPGVAEAVTSVCTDSRAAEHGSCFVALRGEVHDGHAHLEAAARAGATVVVVERDVATGRLPSGVTVVRTQDSLVALGDLGRAHARRWRAADPARRIVGITGSAGKTTTRVATAALLAETARTRGEVYASSGNLNNRIGVPMVLFGLGPEHRVAVVEMGMNVRGEIAELCRIAEPEIGVVTLIAAAHTEGLGSLDAVADEKGALFRALPESGVAIGNADDRRVMAQMARSPARRRYRYGCTPEADRWISARTAVDLTRSRVRIGGEDFSTPLLGEAGALACAAAITVVECAFGLRALAEVCERAFAQVEVGAGAGRLVPHVLAGDVAVIDDTYNANPASACASIQAAAEIAQATGRRLVLVLGEMRELGALSRSGHDEVGRAAGASGAGAVFSVGGGDAARITARATEASASAVHGERVEDVALLVAAAVRAGDLVLVKGSRSIGTERVVDAIAARAPGVKGKTT
jgi:UDP-N-acetylmuramoyl-tripeptide--D-alanyl-D-alanine ligase